MLPSVRLERLIADDIAMLMPDAVLLLGEMLSGADGSLVPVATPTMRSRSPVLWKIAGSTCPKLNGLRISRGLPLVGTDLPGLTVKLLARGIRVTSTPIIGCTVS